MRVRAAVIERAGAHLEVETVDLADPGPGELRVRMQAAGVCRSDLHVAQTGEGLRFPAVLGHEGAGIVEATGEGVRLAVGTLVVLSWTPRCGVCRRCLEGRPQLCQELSTSPVGGALRRGDRALGLYMGLGCLAEAVVVPQACAVPVPADLPPAKLCLLGCGVTTGYGAAVHTAGIRAGETVVVVGCGAVGLSAVQGALTAGARTVVAVEPVKSRRYLAVRLGATHSVDPESTDWVAAVQSITAGGADAAVEASGDPTVMARLLDAVHAGGRAVVVGVPRFADTISISPYHLLLEKKLTGSIYGSADPHVDFPILADLYRQGRLDLDALTGRTYTLEDVNDAVEELACGGTPRPVIQM